MSRPDMSTVPGEFAPTKNFSFQDNQVIGNSLKTKTHRAKINLQKYQPWQELGFNNASYANKDVGL